MTRLNERQAALKGLAFTRIQAYKALKASIDEELKVLREQRLHDAKLDASRAANEAVSVGVPITQLGEPGGLNTRHYPTIKEFLRYAAPDGYETATPQDEYEYVPNPEFPWPPEYRRTADGVTGELTKPGTHTYEYRYTPTGAEYPKVERIKDNSGHPLIEQYKRDLAAGKVPEL